MTARAPLRLGRVGDSPVTLKPGDAFRVDMDHEMVGDEQRAPLPYPQLYRALTRGAELLIGDGGGGVRLRVETCGPEHAQTRVMVGGVVADNQEVRLLP
jgi:pyruvate kinase